MSGNDGGNNGARKSDAELDESAREKLPGVLEHSRKLYRFAQDKLSGKWPYRPSDHLAYMAWVFSCRQMDHLKSVGILIENGQHMDAALIARSMLEGLALLWWPDGPTLWRHYAFVHDWRKLRKIMDPSPELQTRMRLTEEMLASVGTIFHTEKALKAMAKGEPLPDDPFRPPQRWAGKGIDQISELAGLRTEYEEFYRKLATWLHWGATSFIGPLNVQEQGERGISYSSQDQRRAIVALLAAHQAAAGTLIKFCETRDPTLVSQVEELRTNLGKFLLGELPLPA